MENPNADVFVYTGEGGVPAPRDVVRLRVDPSVTSIPARAFYERKKLTEVELCEGVVEIGVRSFRECWHSITKINIPNSLRRICDHALHGSLRCPIRLHDGIESIGLEAFCGCIFTNFRVPPLITLIAEGMICNCRTMFSVEIPENVRNIKKFAFYNCYCLRNVAIPPNAVFGKDIFFDEEDEDEMAAISDLQLLFGDSNARITWELKHRFDGLPIHRLVYYQSYNQGVLQNLVAAIDLRWGQRRTLRVKLDPTGSQQDCLGMTPLHILTCSSVHDLEVYRLIVEKYPTNLITEDKWGALPLLYAFWGAAPTEIIQFLLESYQSLYPCFEFNWTMMVETMGRCDTPKESIENLLCVKQIHFHDQSIDWEYLLNEFAKPSNLHLNIVLLQEQMRFLFMCGMSDRVEALPFKIWRDCIINMIHTANFEYNWDNSLILLRIRDRNQRILPEIRSKLAYFEGELPKLEEATTILELALWKTRLDYNCIKENTTLHQKRMKTDESSFRSHCRVTCEADVVIQHVLPFLL